MTTSVHPAQLAAIMELLFPEGEWSIRDSDIINIPDGALMPTESDLITALEVITASKSDGISRSTARTALRQQWDGLPAWINGPYRPLFDAANRLLDEGLDDAAFEMIDAVEPTAKIANDPEKSATFAAVKTQLAAAIQSLKS